MMSTVCDYPTNVSDAQCEVLQLLLPKPKWRPGGPGRKPLELRRVINGICYVNKTGCQWRMMPTDLGNGHTSYGYFRRWRHAGVWGRVMDTLRQWERQSQGRLPEPSVCCADSQSIKTTTQDTDVGFDGNKKIKGRKRHILVDTLGLIVAVVVTAANTDDRQGLVALLPPSLPQPPVPRSSPCSNPSGPPLPHPAARVQTAWRCAPPGTGARQQGCCAARGAGGLAAQKGF